jgi:hypothetical protein
MAYIKVIISAFFYVLVTFCILEYFFHILTHFIKSLKSSFLVSDEGFKGLGCGIEGLGCGIEGLITAKGFITIGS